MIITVTSFKGGVGKTTSAVHLAAVLSKSGPTILFDADSTKNATAWCRRSKREPGQGIPFAVASIEMVAKLAGQYEHKVIDTGQKPSTEELEAAAAGCDLMIVPTPPSALDTDGLGQTLRALTSIQATNYRVLLTRVAPDSAKQVAELRDLLEYCKAPAFTTEIPRLKAFEKAAGMGEIVRDTNDPQAARAWAAYEAVGLELGL